MQRFRVGFSIIVEQHCEVVVVAETEEAARRIVEHCEEQEDYEVTDETAVVGGERFIIGVELEENDNGC